MTPSFTLSPSPPATVPGPEHASYQAQNKSPARTSLQHHTPRVYSRLPNMHRGQTKPLLQSEAFYCCRRNIIGREHLQKGIILRGRSGCDALLFMRVTACLRSREAMASIERGGTQNPKRKETPPARDKIFFGSCLQHSGVKIRNSSYCNSNNSIQRQTTGHAPIDKCRSATPFASALFFRPLSKHRSNIECVRSVRFKRLFVGLVLQSLPTACRPLDHSSIEGNTPCRRYYGRKGALREKVVV